MAYGALRCTTCGHSYHNVLAEVYSPDEKPNGTMFRLKDFCRKNCWSSFPENDRAVTGADLWCPGCGSPYLKIHERITWFDDAGNKVGQGPDAFRSLFRPPGPGDTDNPDFYFFSDENSDTWKSSDDAQKPGPQAYQPPKKGAGKKGSGKKNTGKKKEASDGQ